MSYVHTSQNIVCSKKKLSQIFISATTTSINDFYHYFDAYARDAQILEEVNENFFLAQIQAEVGNDLKSVRENLNYSCGALENEFSYYRDRSSEASQDGRCNGHEANQTNIGNKAYANRIGNGDVASGDGYMFRGGGFFQLTGRENYQSVVNLLNKFMRDDKTAEELASHITTVGAGVLTAMAFWQMNDMAKCTDIDCCTKVVDPNTDTYDKRKQLYLAIAALPAEGA